MKFNKKISVRNNRVFLRLFYVKSKNPLFVQFFCPSASIFFTVLRLRILFLLQKTHVVLYPTIVTRGREPVGVVGGDIIPPMSESSVSSLEDILSEK